MTDYPIRNHRGYPGTHFSTGWVTDWQRPRRHYPVVKRTRLPAGPRAASRQTPETLLTELSHALHLWTCEIDLDSASGRELIGRKLARALRAQRRDALAGRWHYDIARHKHLLELRRRLSLLQARLPRAVRRNDPGNPV